MPRGTTIPCSLWSGRESNPSPEGLRVRPYPSSMPVPPQSEGRESNPLRVSARAAPRSPEPPSGPTAPSRGIPPLPVRTPSLGSSPVFLLGLPPIVVPLPHHHACPRYLSGLGTDRPSPPLRQKTTPMRSCLSRYRTGESNPRPRGEIPVTLPLVQCGARSGPSLPAYDLRHRRARPHRTPSTPARNRTSADGFGDRRPTTGPPGLDPPLYPLRRTPARRPAAGFEPTTTV